MLYILFVILMLWIFGKLATLALKATWGIGKIVFNIVLAPLFLIGLVFAGFIYIALMVLVILGLVMLGFAGMTVITNPYDKDIEYFNLLAGMYDAEGNLIGVMDSMDTNGINAMSKARATASWLPDSREVPDKVESLKASARVTLFVGE